MLTYKVCFRCLDPLTEILWFCRTAHRMEMPHVGRIRSMTVGHNNMGRGPSWHLDMVQVRAQSVL